MQDQRALTARPGLTYDPNVITYRATTTHFTDYAYSGLMFGRGPSEVAVGQSANLEVTEYDLASAGNLYLASTTQSYPGPTYVTSWSVNGMPSGTVDTWRPTAMSSAGTARTPSTRRLRSCPARGTP